jgi:carbon-monoxide dehydrogenase large subunit
MDVTRARSAPGVIAVFTGADLEGKAGPIPCVWNVPHCNLKVPAHPLLAREKVRHTGDGVAMVVAESRAAARDAVDLIEVSYESLEAGVGPERMTQPGAPLVHEDVPGNIAFTWIVAGGDAEQAFGTAEVTIEQRIVHPRLLPMTIEPRAAVARYDRGSGQLTMWLTTQSPHLARLLFSAILQLPEHRIRIIAPEVGGGFGSKLPTYADEVLVALAAIRLGRPVKWTEDRSESCRATVHGRDHVEYAEMCGTRDGTITGLRTRVYAGLGAYASTTAPGIPTILHGLLYSGAYAIPNIHGTIQGVYTNGAPVDGYRGGGRAEAAFLVERMVNLFAREIGMDPTDVRRKNFIPPDRFPFVTATGISYDSGNYEPALDKALRILDYKAFRARQAEVTKEGRYLGVGVASYVDMCGLGPSGVAGEVGFGAGLYDSALIRVNPTGTVRVYIGASPHGQGQETTFGQIVADEFGCPVENVEIVHGDTETTPQGWGSFGSRTTAVCGPAVKVAAQRVMEKARKIAAHLMDASEDEVEWQSDRFAVRGSPGQGRTFAEVALVANVGRSLPEGVEPGLEASASFDPPNFVFPFGSHVCTVEVDAETGMVEVLRYIAVDDCGPHINPVIVQGQIHGGVVQGLGEALQEMAAYDDAGRLVTGNMMDYAVPRASQMPRIETDSTVTPSPVNPLGVKGCGDVGAIAAAACLVNAVCDALSPLGVVHIDKPLTPARVWAAIRQAKGVAP